MCPTGKEFPVLGARSFPEEADTGEWGSGKAGMRVQGHHWHPGMLQALIPHMVSPK